MAKQNKTEETISDVAAVDPMMPENPVMPEGMFSDHEREQTSFAPYWKPSVGKWFYGILVEVDTKNPKFIRYQFKALLDTPCQRGPGDESDEAHEKVMVKAGEIFSVSHYTGLQDILTDYMNVNFPVALRVLAERKTKTKDDNDFWHFVATVDKKTKALLTEYRNTKKKAKLGSGKQSERPSLES
jgi:hypothetical protein